MKKYSNLAFALLLSVAIVACKKSDDAPAASGDGTTHLSGNLSTQTLDASKKYTLVGLVYVTSGQTLTIPAGTVVYGDKASKAALVIARGGKLVATGTSSNPVVFTTNAPAGYRNAGDWGGIILLGKATTNNGPNAVIEGPTDFTIGNLGGSDNGLYGGSDDADNSGTLQYVRIEYAGIAYQPNVEINSLTFGAVGNGTTIDHIQASYGGDDSFEWFGGTVNAKYLVAYKGWDDDFDTDNGFRGKVQFGFALRAASLADQSGSNGFESDNNAAGDGLTPQTAAMFSNITILGPYTFSNNISGNFKHGAHVRRNSAESIYNSIIVGFPTAAVNFDKTSGSLKVKNNFFANNKVKALFTAGNSNDTTGFYAANKWSASANTIIDTTAAESSVAFLKAASLPTTGAIFDSSLPGMDNSFWTNVSYKGAFGTTPDASWNWNAGWLNWTPASTNY
jgi:hypothetical protein